MALLGSFMLLVVERDASKQLYLSVVSLSEDEPQLVQCVGSADWELLQWKFTRWWPEGARDPPSLHFFVLPEVRQLAMLHMLTVAKSCGAADLLQRRVLLRLAAWLWSSSGASALEGGSFSELADALDIHAVIHSSLQRFQRKASDPQPCAVNCWQMSSRLWPRAANFCQVSHCFVEDMDSLVLLEAQPSGADGIAAAMTPPAAASPRSWHIVLVEAARPFLLAVRGASAGTVGRATRVWVDFARADSTGCFGGLPFLCHQEHAGLDALAVLQQSAHASVGDASAPPAAVAAAAGGGADVSHALQGWTVAEPDPSGPCAMDVDELHRPPAPGSLAEAPALASRATLTQLPSQPEACGSPCAAN